MAAANFGSEKRKTLKKNGPVHFLGIARGFDHAASGIRPAEQGENPAHPPKTFVRFERQGNRGGF